MVMKSKHISNICKYLEKEEPSTILSLKSAIEALIKLPDNVNIREGCWCLFLEEEGEGGGHFGIISGHR